jgi:hypothetical protein
MDDLRKYVKNKIDKNQLNLDIDQTILMIISYRKIYENVSDDILFFHYIMNKVGEILNKYVTNDNEKKELELLGWLRVRGSLNSKVVYYEYETDDEFYQWLQYRIKYYKRMIDVKDIRMINYLELSTMNFITDINTNCDYTLQKLEYKSSVGTKNILNFKKTEYGTNQDNLSFIKYVSNKFNQGYIFYPKPQ